MAQLQNVQSDFNVNLEATLEQLQISGVQFTIKFLGSLLVPFPMNSLSAEQQTDFTNTAIARLVDAVANNAEAYGAVSVYNKFIDLNISYKALLLIDTSSAEKILYRFQINEISLVSKDRKALGPYFCFVAKASSENSGTSKPERRCFVFDASDPEELNDIYGYIHAVIRYNEVLTGFSSADSTPTTSTPKPFPPPSSPFTLGESCSSINNSSRHSSVSSANEASSSSNQRLKNWSGSSSTQQSTSNATLNSAEGATSSRFQHLIKDLDKWRWFHEKIKREEAEALLQKDGQFLVRPSETLAQQIVLSGMDDGVKRHICLIEHGSRICSSIGEFDSVVHLINYFHGSGQPLATDKGVVLRLTSPIPSPIAPIGGSGNNNHRNKKNSGNNHF